MLYSVSISLFLSYLVLRVPVIHGRFRGRIIEQKMNGFVPVIICLMQLQHKQTSLHNYVKMLSFYNPHYKSSKLILVPVLHYVTTVKQSRLPKMKRKIGLVVWTRLFQPKIVNRPFRNFSLVQRCMHQ